MKNGKCLHWYGFARKKLIDLISLCRLCVLCVSVVVFPGNSFDHGGTENTEGAQRRRIILLFVQSRFMELCTESHAFCVRFFAPEEQNAPLEPSRGTTAETKPLPLPGTPPRLLIADQIRSGRSRA